jgi:hypothetical protein
MHHVELLTLVHIASRNIARVPPPPPLTLSLLLPLLPLSALCRLLLPPVSCTPAASAAACLSVFPSASASAVVVVVIPPACTHTGGGGLMGRGGGRFPMNQRPFQSGMPPLQGDRGPPFGAPVRRGPPWQAGPPAGPQQDFRPGPGPGQGPGPMVMRREVGPQGPPGRQPQAFAGDYGGSMLWGGRELGLLWLWLPHSWCAREGTLRGGRLGIRGIVTGGYIAEVICGRLTFDWVAGIHNRHSFAATIPFKTQHAQFVVLG